MNLKLSQKDINFIRPLWKFTNIFLVTPYYDFNKNVAKYHILSKLHGSVLILAKIIWIGNVIQDEKEAQFWNSLAFTQKFSYIFSLANLILLSLLIVIKSSFMININAWNILITNLQFVDIKLQNKGKAERNILKKFYFRYIIILLLFVTFSY